MPTNRDTTRRHRFGVALLATMVLSGCVPEHRRESPTPNPVASPANHQACLSFEGLQEVSLLLPEDEHALAITAQGRKAWVASSDAAAGRISSVDMPSKSLTPIASVGWAPSYVAFDQGTIWVSNTTGDGSHTTEKTGQNSIAVVDASRGGVIRTFDIDDPGAIAISSSAWLTTGGSAVTQVDTKSGDTGRTIGVAPDQVTFLRASRSRVWITAADPVSSSGTITEIDASTGSVVSTHQSSVPLGPVLSSEAGDFVAFAETPGSWTLGKYEHDSITPVGVLPVQTDVNSLTVDNAGGGWGFTTFGCVFTFNLETAELRRDALPVVDLGSDLLAVAATDSGAFVLGSAGVAELRPRP